jgi:hypothetical protein
MCGVKRVTGGPRDRGTGGQGYSLGPGAGLVNAPKKFAALFLHADQPNAGACWELKYSSTAAVYQA